jgi:hypothetical protein
MSQIYRDLINTSLGKQIAESSERCYSTMKVVGSIPWQTENRKREISWPADCLSSRTTMSREVNLVLLRNYITWLGKTRKSLWCNGTNCSPKKIDDVHNNVTRVVFRTTERIYFPGTRKRIVRTLHPDLNQIWIFSTYFHQSPQHQI